MNLNWLVLALVLLAAAPAAAEVKLPGLISDGMVLQRGRNVRIWGWAGEGEKVTVKFRGQTLSDTAKDGRWSVSLKPMRAGGPFPMTISGANTIEFSNVLVGDVWVCSGQSNMQWPMGWLPDEKDEVESSANPRIRLFSVPHTQAEQPRDDIESSWTPCDPQDVVDFSAVGYFFGRDLQKAVKVPIGLIDSSVGGTPAEAWTRESYLDAAPDLKAIVYEYRESAQQGSWQSGGLYNGMIAPLLPFPIKGAIWYQGESNARRPETYETLLPALIRNWREDWGVGEFAFLIVQIAPFGKNGKVSPWSVVREAQMLTSLRTPRVGLVVTTDIGDRKNIHPLKKEPVGARLALAARAIAYGEKLVYSGPIYKSMKVEGDKIALRFNHVGGGLMAVGSVLRGFEIAGKEGQYVRADAVIDGDRVIVSSEGVPRPVSVRYGWAQTPQCNLSNREGLPASPFRTDRGG